MCKRLIALAAVGLGGYVATQTSAWSYVKTGWNRLVSSAEENVSPEFEIERLRGLVADLDKDHKKLVGDLTGHLYQVQTLTERIPELERRVRASELYLKEEGSRVKHLETGDARKAAVRDLKVGAKKLATDRQTLRGMNARLGQERKMCKTIRKQLELLKSKRAQLASRLDQAESLLKEVKLQEMAREYQYDDTNLSKAERALHKLEERLAKRKIRGDLAEQYDPNEAGPEDVDRILAEAGVEPVKRVD